MTIRPLFELPLLAAIWGASFLFMKIGGPEFGPVLFMAMRTLIASLLLIAILLLKKQFSLLKNNKKEIFIVGLMNTAIPFCVIWMGNVNFKRRKYICSERYYANVWCNCCRNMA